MTKLQTTLTLDDFKFIVAALNDALIEIVENQETKQEEMYSSIEIELQGVQQALQLRCVVSIATLSVRTPEVGDELAQLHRITDLAEARFRKAQDEVEKSIQALTQVQGLLV
jgi:hypothetical protein